MLPPLPTSPLTTALYSLYLWMSWFCFLDSTYKWDEMTSSLSHLFQLSTVPFRSIYIVENGKISLFFLANIPLCIYSTFSLSIHLLLDIGYFNILAIVNNVAMNIRVRIFLWISVFAFFCVRSKYAQVKLLGHMAVLFVIFGWSLYYFPSDCPSSHFY